MAKDTGGQAFPKTGNYIEDQESTFDSENQDGMTLRDYFAAKVLAGCECPDWNHPTPRKATDSETAERCYAIADAMLKERKNG